MPHSRAPRPAREATPDTSREQLRTPSVHPGTVHAPPPLTLELALLTQSHRRQARGRLTQVQPGCIWHSIGAHPKRHRTSSSYLVSRIGKVRAQFIRTPVSRRHHRRADKCSLHRTSSLTHSHCDVTRNPVNVPSSQKQLEPPHEPDRANKHTNTNDTATHTHTPSTTVFRGMGTPFEPRSPTPAQPQHVEDSNLQRRDHVLRHGRTENLRHEAHEQLNHNCSEMHAKKSGAHASLPNLLPSSFV